MAETFGKTTFSDLATTTTTTDGAWSYIAHPTIQTVYEAGWNGVTSPSVTIKVRPLLALKLVSAATGSFNITVTGDRSFGGKYVLVQRLTSTGPVVMKHVVLDTSSSATFKVRLHHGRNRLRAVIPSSQAAPGYLSGMSNVVLVSR